MHTISIPLAVLLLALLAPAQNLYKHARKSVSLIADTRASAIGDILTVVIRETTKIKQEDKLNRQTKTGLAARLEAFTLDDNMFPDNTLPKIDIRQERSHEGNAKQEKDSNVEAKIAVIVIDVMPNGNLVVAGSRIVRVDDEEKTFRISGIVRPLDVSKDNSVPSSQVADARVSITGEGGNTRMVTKGPIGKFFDILMWAAWPF